MASFYSVTNPHKNSTIKPIVVVLAPGAGGSRTSPALISCSKKLSTLGITTLCFDFPYRMAGKKAPDSPKVLNHTFLEAIDVAVKKCSANLAKQGKLNKKIKVIIGGRSMGGRVASLISAEKGIISFDVQLNSKESISASVLACLFLSYPLHAPGKTERKDSHFSKILQKCLFVSGDRDVFATPAELKSSAKKVKGATKLIFLEGGDHELKTRKSDPFTFDELNDQLSDQVAKFLKAL